MTWFKREKKPMEAVAARHVQTEGLWIKCAGCKEPLWKKDLEANLQVCAKCGYHYKISAYERLSLLFDAGWQEMDASLHSTDPLNFKATKTYKESIEKLPARVGVRDAVVNAEGSIEGIPVVVSAMEYNFIGNLRYPMLGDGLTREWLGDPVAEFDRLVAGFHLHSVDLYLASTRHVSLGFRPLITF